MTVESVDFQQFEPAVGLPGYDPRTSPNIQMAVVSNQWVKLMHFSKVGDYVPGHLHNFDHISLLSKGSVEVLVNSETTVFEAPTLIYIKKGTKHQITALAPDTVLACIHALRDSEVSENIIAEDMIPRGSDPLSVISDFKLAPIAQPFK